MMNQPTFSIILPSYNGSRTIVRALQSALMQTGSDYEVLIVDDGSTDNTYELLEPFLTKFPSTLSYIKKPNGGVASARNLGIDNTTGDFLIFLDVDDELEANALALIRLHLAENTQTKFIVGNYQIIDEFGNKKLSKTKCSFSGKDELFVSFLKKKISVRNGPCVFHRKVFNSIRYPEKLDTNEDIPVFAIAFALYKTTHLKESLATMYKSGDSLRHSGSRINAPQILTDIIFDKNILPAHLFVHKKTYVARCLLSMARGEYKKCNYKEARHLFHKAFLLDISNVFRLSFVGKYLRSWRF